MYYNPLFFQTSSLIEQAFFETDLGKLYQSIPFKELASKIPMPRNERSGRGRKPFLKIEGGIALQVLKHYSGLSDELLIERLNTDWCMQYFCGVQLKARKIKDKNLVSWWRCYIGKHLNIKELQQVLASHWKPELEQTHVLLMDATVYESNIRYPTDVKLIWEACHKVYVLLQEKRKLLGLRASRSNYDKQRQQYLRQQKSRKRSKRKDKRLRKTLLKYLYRLRKSLNKLQRGHQFQFSSKEKKILKTLTTLYKQQYQLLYGDREKKIEKRIVSINKPYVRPIVRGKEIKPVEFGAKVHKIQVNGISFMEHISYEAFHEGKRLKQAVGLHRKLFGGCHQLGADQIYATNENRKYCTRLHIATCFVAKGREGKQEDQKATLRAVLGNIRSTVLEGSFGNEKNHYLLTRVKARIQATELAWIFFGMLTSNAVILSNRKQEKQKEERKRRRA